MYARYSRHSVGAEDLVPTRSYLMATALLPARWLFEGIGEVGEHRFTADSGSSHAPRSTFCLPAGGCYLARAWRSAALPGSEDL